MGRPAGGRTAVPLASLLDELSKYRPLSSDESNALLLALKRQSASMRRAQGLPRANAAQRRG